MRWLLTSCPGRRPTTPGCALGRVNDEANKKIDETKDEISKERAAGVVTASPEQECSAMVARHVLASRSDLRSGCRRLDCVVFAIAGAGPGADTDTRRERCLGAARSAESRR